MSVNDPIFFPNVPQKNPLMQKCEGAVDQEYMRMQEFLEKQVEEGALKDKLHDQLIWLQYQIRYFKESHDQHMLEENFNWVVSNFNHDLNLNAGQEFNYVQTLLDRNL